MALTSNLKNRILRSLDQVQARNEMVTLLDQIGEVEPGVAVTHVTLAVVTGVDGTGSNAASKADVDARLSTIQTKINDLLASLRGGGSIAT